MEQHTNMMNGFGFRRLSHLNQTKQIAQINKLRTLQSEVKFWEDKQDNYKKSVEIFKQYIECLSEFNHPRSLINAYIRMGQYCESMGDRLLAQDTYRMALELEQMIKVDYGHIKNLKAKIDSLSWF